MFVGAIREPSVASPQEYNYLDTSKRIKGKIVVDAWEYVNVPLKVAGEKMESLKT